VSDAARDERVVRPHFADRSPVLRQDARLTGVLDWDAAGRGGRGHDLALLFSNAFAQADRLDEAPAEEVVNRLGQRGLDVSGAEAFGVSLAYEALEAQIRGGEESEAHVVAGEPRETRSHGIPTAGCGLKRPLPRRASRDHSFSRFR
jgi:hypothetical protein